MDESIYGFSVSVERLQALFSPFFSEPFQILDAQWDSDFRRLRLRIFMPERLPYRDQCQPVAYLTALTTFTGTDKIDGVFSEYHAAWLEKARSEV